MYDADAMKPMIVPSLLRAILSEIARDGSKGPVGAIRSPPKTSIKPVVLERLCRKWWATMALGFPYLYSNKALPLLRLLTAAYGTKLSIAALRHAGRPSLTPSGHR